MEGTTLVRVRGRSMCPTLRPGDVLWAGPPKSLQRGDVVLVRKGGLLVKRLVGLPGEKVTLRSSRIYVHGSPLPEPYVPESAAIEPKADQSVQIPESAFYVLGDARDDSLDSRRWGPVNRSEIDAVIRFRIWPPWRWAVYRGVLVGFLLAFGALGLASESSDRLLAFASETRLAMMIGKFNARQGWVKATQFYSPPQPGDPFTLYGPPGKVAVVTIAESQAPNPQGVFANWSAKTTPWDNRAVPYALAISGTEPLPAATLEPIPLDSSKFRAIMARYLQSKGLSTDQPLLTQAYLVPIEDRGREEALLVAHSDMNTITTEKSGDIYATVLLWWNDRGNETVFPLVSQAAHKPAGQSLEEYQGHYGIRDYLRVLCAVDIDGDGLKEFAVYRAQQGTTRIEIFHFDGRKVKEVLALDRPLYI